MTYLSYVFLKNKGVGILTETHINLDQIPHIFFSSADSHAKGLLVILHLGLESVTEVNTDPKGMSVSFKITPSNDRILCVYPIRGIAPGKIG